MLAGILVGRAHLLVEVILYEIPEVQNLFIWGSQFLGPFAKGCRTIEVAIEAELGIRLQPLLVLLKELLVGCAAAGGRPFLCEEFLQIVHLGLEHALVVNLRQRVELLTDALKLFLLLFVLQCWQLAEVSVLRMQGIDADGVIGVGVLPGVGHIGIVDGQHL